MQCNNDIWIWTFSISPSPRSVVGIFAHLLHFETTELRKQKPMQILLFTHVIRSASHHTHTHAFIAILLLSLFLHEQENQVEQFFFCCKMKSALVETSSSLNHFKYAHLFSYFMLFVWLKFSRHKLTSI